MKRPLFAAAFVSAIALVLAACDDNRGPAYAYYPPLCSRYTSCGTCTPVVGCGWCFTAREGACVDDPNDCSRASEFTFTWEPSGCPGVDASVGPPAGDAASSVESSAEGSVAEQPEASVAEAAMEPPLDATDAAPTGDDSAAAEDVGAADAGATE